MECGVCLMPFAEEERGKLNSCDHKFCFECIGMWAEQCNACPACKQRFKTITKADGTVQKVRRRNLRVDEESDSGEEDTRDAIARSSIVCSVCGSSDRMAAMVLCSRRACDYVAHFDCVSLPAVPEEFWYCSICEPRMTPSPAPVAPPHVPAPAVAVAPPVPVTTNAHPAPNAVHRAAHANAGRRESGVRAREQTIPGIWPPIPEPPPAPAPPRVPPATVEEDVYTAQQREALAELGRRKELQGMKRDQRRGALAKEAHSGGPPAPARGASGAYGFEGAHHPPHTSLGAPDAPFRPHGGPPSRPAPPHTLVPSAYHYGSHNAYDPEQPEWSIKQDGVKAEPGVQGTTPQARSTVPKRRTPNAGSGLQPLDDIRAEVEDKLFREAIFNIDRAERVQRAGGVNVPLPDLTWNSDGVELRTAQSFDGGEPSKAAAERRRKQKMDAAR